MKITPDMKDKKISGLCRKCEELEAQLPDAWTRFRAAKKALNDAAWEEHTRKKVDPTGEPKHDLAALQAEFDQSCEAVKGLRAQHEKAREERGHAIAQANGKRYAPNENPADPEDNYFD